MPQGRSKLPIDDAQLLSAAQLAANQAGEFLRAQEGRLGEGDWQSKGPADFVTEVDKESERIITEALTRAVPDSVVLGEELNPDGLSRAPRTGHPAPVTWIVDPLDGTTNFLHLFAIYAISIAAVVDGELRAGLVDHVPLRLRYTATKSGGAWQDGRRIAVSSRTDPRHALIGTGVPFKDMSLWADYHRQIQAVAAGTAGIRRPGSAALDLCDVAAGRTDGFWELRLAPWDVAAGTLIVREAGGRVTDLAGAPDVLNHGPLVAGNPAIHSWLMKTLRV